MKPSRPKVVFRPTRPRSRAPCVPLPCRMSLTTDQASDKLPKKLLMPVCTNDGSTFLYAVATGFRATLSTVSLNENMARLKPSYGSRGLGPAQPLRTAVAATATAARRKVRAELYLVELIFYRPFRRRLC